jgi:hypothetical protein
MAQPAVQPISAAQLFIAAANRNELPPRVMAVQPQRSFVLPFDILKWIVLQLDWVSLVTASLVCQEWLVAVCLIVNRTSECFCHEDFSPQHSPEWHARRRLRITAAKVASVVGLGWYYFAKKPEMYETATRAFRNWTEQPRPGEKFEIEFMLPAEYGTLHEERIRVIMERLLGVPIGEAGSFDHAKYRWLGMSPDGMVPPLIVEGQQRVVKADGRELYRSRRLFLGASQLEIKCTPTGLPFHKVENVFGDVEAVIPYYKVAHAAQIMQQMYLTKRQWTWHPYWYQDSLMVYLWEFTPPLWQWIFERANWQHDMWLAGAREIPTTHPFASVRIDLVERLWFEGGRGLTPAQKASLPPAPRVMLVYTQKHRLGPLAATPDDAVLRDRRCWPGSPPDTDPVYDNWKTLPEMPTGPVQFRITSIQRVRPPVVPEER